MLHTGREGFPGCSVSCAPYIHCFHDAGALLQNKGFLVIEHSRRHCVFWVHETVTWVQKKGSLAIGTVFIVFMRRLHARHQWYHGSVHDDCNHLRKVQPEMT
jgi:hypothetical protein